MTSDPIDAVVLAYLDYLDGTGPEPSLDHLTPEEREVARDLIDSANAGRGIDPYESRPSIHSLLAGTDLENWLTNPDTVGLSLDAIRTDVISALGAAAEVIEDGAALNEGIRSDAVILYRAVRLRIQFRDDISTPAGLAQIDPRAAAGPVYGRFPDTAGLIVVIGDQDLSSVPIGPFDTDEYIGAPDGQVHPPGIHRPVLPLFDTLRSYVDVAAPDLTVAAEQHTPELADITEIIRAETDAAVAAIVSEGRRAKSAAKKVAWTEDSEIVAELVDGIVTQAWDHSLEPDELKSRVETAVAAA